MRISRPSGNDKIVARAAEVPLQLQTQIVVEPGDCCVVTHQGQVVGAIGPGHWWAQQYPLLAPLMADGGRGASFLYVLSRPPSPVKLGGVLGEGERFIAQAIVAIHDPVALVREVVGQSDGDVEPWLQVQLTRALRNAYDPATPLAQQQELIGQAVSSALSGTFTPAGITFERFGELKLLGAPGGAAQPSAGPQGGGGGGGRSDRVELIGPIAGRVESPSNDPKVRRFDQFGFFVAADPLALRAYSGSHCGWRWLARGAGDLADHVGGWPLAPNGDTSDYFPDEQQARAYYAALRQHAFASMPGLQAQDTRQQTGLNAPNAYAETLWSHGREVFYLIYDHMEDMIALGHETDVIGIFPAGPPTTGAPPLPLVTYKTRSDVLYLAARRGANGAAEHVLIVFSDKHLPRPTITEGLPRAEWMHKFEEADLRFQGNILVVHWGRFSGAEVLGAEHAADPLRSLAAKLGDRLAVELKPHHEAAGRLGTYPAAYAVRMEPGGYSVHYYELSTDAHGKFFCCAISRDGAESFMPEAVGNAGGVVLGGLSIQQYAMLSVERDNLMMQLGPQAIYSPQMQAICHKYGVPYNRDGTAGRVYEWEHYITHDPAFSAQWAMQLGIARMRLQGREPTEQDLSAIAKQQNAAQQALEHNAKQLDAIRDAAIHLIRSSAQRSPEDVTAMAHQWFGQLGVENVLHKALRILREPDEFGRFDNVATSVEPLARAHYRSMSAEDQRFEGSEDKYFKEEREVIFGAYDIEVPGLFNKLFG